MSELAIELAPEIAVPTPDAIEEPVSAILPADSSALAVLPKPIAFAADAAVEAAPLALEAISAPFCVADAAVSRPAAVDCTAEAAGEGVDGLGLVKGDISLPMKL